jgi:hypothetical protein
MADSAIVLILLLAGDAADPATQAAVSAVRRPLGDEAVVLVRPSEARPTDDEALALARQVHALSAVTLDWEDVAHSRVRVRVQLANGGQRYDYELAFKPEDQPAERGRAVGLALTPVLVRAVSAARAPPSSAPAPGDESTAERPMAAAQAPPPPQNVGVDNRLPTAPAPGPPPYAAGSSWFAVEVASSGSVGIGGNALGLGPAVALRAAVLGPLALRGVALVRFGAVDAASATAASIGVGGGASYRVLRINGKGLNLEAGLRVDVLAMQLAFSEDVAGTTVQRSRWLTAVDVLAELAWPLASHLTLLTSGGVEIAAGPTTITVGGTPVDHIPVGRVVAELGVRIAF